jgi:hypothetical protein
MLRATAALFGTVFLPVGISFFFILDHRYWRSGVAAVLCSAGFYYIAWRAHDLPGIDEISNTHDVAVPDFPTDSPTRPPTPPVPPAKESPP